MHQAKTSQKPKINILSGKHPEYLFIQIESNIGIGTDLTELKTIVAKEVTNGYYHMALQFSKGSYLFTQSISVIIQCVEIVKKHNGSITLVNPNPEIRELLATINFNYIVSIVNSIDELPSPR